MLGEEGNVMCRDLTHFPHNYNYVSRATMYGWFNKHLKLGLEEPVVEEDWEPLAPEEYTVWNDEHPRPKPGPGYERSLTKFLAMQSDRQIANLEPAGAKSLAEYRKVIGGAFDILIGRGLPAPGDIKRETIGERKRDGHVALTVRVRNAAQGEELLVLRLHPTDPPWNKQLVIWIDGQGKGGLHGENGLPRPEIQRLLDAGASVLSASLLYQGDFAADGKKLEQARVVDNPREFAGYTFGYNHALFAQRAHDILTLVAYAQNSEFAPEKIHLVGVNGAAPWAAAARAQCGKAIARLAIDTQGFRFAEITSYRDLDFLPGAVKYGDLPGLLALSAPHPLWLAGEGGALPSVVSSAYQSAGASRNVVSFKGALADSMDPIGDWLLQP